MITAYKDGWLTIKETDTFSDEPTRITRYWPIVRDSLASLIEMEILDKEASYNNDGTYQVRIAPYQYRRVCLTEGGQTKPIVMETEPIAPPKVRKGVEIRYRNGRWEKYLKSQGWVIA